MSGIEWATTQDGVEWLVRPAIRGMCLYESLLDGTLTLEHVFEMNDSLDTLDENQRRWDARPR